MPAQLSRRGLPHIIQPTIQLVQSLYGRGIVQRRSGNAAEADADISAATAMEANIATDFARYGVK